MPKEVAEPTGQLTVMVSAETLHEALDIVQMFQQAELNLIDYLWPGRRVTRHEAATFFRSIACDTCGSAIGERCVTRPTGNPTKNHQQRVVAMVAVTIAVSREIVIHEEVDVEDLLTTAT